MVVAVGDVCFLEKSTERSLKKKGKSKKKKKKEEMLAAACKQGTYIIPAHTACFQLGAHIM